MNIIDSLRVYRVGQFAIFDFTAAFVGMALLAPLLSWLCKKVGIVVPWRSWIIWTLPLAMIAHLLTGTMTPLTKQLVDPHGYLFLKLLMVLLVVLGCCGIRRVNGNKR